MRTEELKKASDKQDDIFFESLHEILGREDSNHNKADDILYWYQIGKKEYHEVASINRASEIREAQIKMLQELQKAGLPMFMAIDQKLQDLIEEGKENSKV